MTQARELYREGKLSPAIASLQEYLRDHPADASARIFLFELLCFAGDFRRAGRQLDAVGGCSGDHGGFVKLYGAALSAELDRQALSSGASAVENPVTAGGLLNGQEFASLTDADEDLGPALEFIGGAEFHRIPYCYLSRVTIPEPARLRDLYFLPASIETGPELNGFVFEQVFLPTLYPGTFRHDNDALRLGRATDWIPGPDGKERPAGQRLLLADIATTAITDVRCIEFRR